MTDSLLISIPIWSWPSTNSNFKTMIYNNVFLQFYMTLFIICVGLSEHNKGVEPNKGLSLFCRDLFCKANTLFSFIRLILMTWISTQALFIFPIYVPYSISYVLEVVDQCRKDFSHVRPCATY